MLCMKVLPDWLVATARAIPAHPGCDEADGECGVPLSKVRRGARAFRAGGSGERCKRGERRECDALLSRDWPGAACVVRKHCGPFMMPSVHLISCCRTCSVHTICSVATLLAR